MVVHREKTPLERLQFLSPCSRCLSGELSCLVITFECCGTPFLLPDFSHKIGRRKMPKERPLLILLLLVLILLLGDLLYRVRMNPQNVNDLLVVVGGIVIGYFLLLPRDTEARKRLYNIVAGGVIGIVLAVGGTVLYDRLAQGNVNWHSHLSTAFGLLLALIIVLVLDRIKR